jgi:hypothetical protein
MLGSQSDADWNLPVDIAEVLLKKMPAETPVGIAVFNTEISHVVIPTTDRKQLFAEISAIRNTRFHFGNGDTSVWDSMISAAKIFDHPQLGDVLYVITDGVDNRSRAGAGSVVTALSCRDIRLFPFVLGERTKTDHTVRPSTVLAYQNLAEMAEETGGWASFAMRPSSTDARNFYFVDKAGNPSALTASLFAQFQLILNTYQLEIDLPEPIYKPQTWHLDFTGLDEVIKSNLALHYPQKLFPCG